MTFNQIATGVEIILGDGSTIVGYPDAAIFLSGEGTNDRNWKGEMGIPWVVWNDLSVGENLPLDRNTK